MRRLSINGGLFGSMMSTQTPNQIIGANAGGTSVANVQAMGRARRSVLGVCLVALADGRLKYGRERYEAITESDDSIPD
jgi:hypothetical protein